MRTIITDLPTPLATNSALSAIVANTSNDPVATFDLGAYPFPCRSQLITPKRSYFAPHEKARQFDTPFHPRRAANDCNPFKIGPVPKPKRGIVPGGFQVPSVECLIHEKYYAERPVFIE
jgi:hypothetical protein